MTMTGEQIRVRGLAALRKELGRDGLIKFLQHYESGKGDYTQNRKKLLSDLSIDNLKQRLNRKKKTVPQTSLIMFGSHLSIAGGMHNALLEAEKLGMDTVQVFTKNQKQWATKPLEAAAIAAWMSERDRLKFHNTVSHDSYLINLATADDAMWKKSIDLFVEELTRCTLLGIPYLVTHPGAHMGTGEPAGLKRVAKALDLIHRRVKPGVITCLEITAGQGSSLGYKLEHLAWIIEHVKSPARLGVCLDTAHLFAAGYDFRGRKYTKFRKTLDATIGIENVKVLHLNDSKKELGSRVDRHEHIGHGTIGLEGFKPILKDKAFKNIPKILETAKENHEDGRPWDAVNLETLRSLL